MKDQRSLPHQAASALRLPWIMGILCVCLAARPTQALPIPTVVADPPVISGFSPVTAPVGTTVSINGIGFVGPITTTFAGGAAAVGSFSPTRISVRVPNGAQTGPITVTTAGGAASTARDFTVGPRVQGAFFADEIVVSAGVYYLQFPNGTPFGYYAYLDDPNYIFHYDLGYEYVFDALDGKGGVYFYDFATQGYFYTSPDFPFPYLYDFSLNSVVYYFPNPDPTSPGRYNTDGIRYFYVFNTDEIISK